MKIKGSVFIVTGGGSGLGAACVKRLIEGGGKVAILDLQKKSPPETENILFVPTDVASESAVQTALDRTVARFGAISAIINCAGIAPAQKVLNKEGAIHPLDTFKKAMDINLNGTFNVIRLAVKMMVQDPKCKATEESGVIINTASVAAFDGQIGQCAYAASKGGIVAMTLPLARELAQYGIRVMTIAPGIFRTPMLETLDPKVQAALGQMVPFPPRLGEPDEFAALVQHILENPMLNGEVIRLDGAIRMAPK